MPKSKPDPGVQRCVSSPESIGHIDQTLQTKSHQVSRPHTLYIQVAKAQRHLMSTHSLIDPCASFQPYRWSSWRQRSKVAHVRLVPRGLPSALTGSGPRGHPCNPGETLQSPSMRCDGLCCCFPVHVGSGLRFLPANGGQLGTQTRNRIITELTQPVDRYLTLKNKSK